MSFSRPDPFLPGTHRALFVLRFLLNTTEETDRIWPNPTTPCYLTNYSRSAETGEIFGLVGILKGLAPPDRRRPTQNHSAFSDSPTTSDSKYDLEGRAPRGRQAQMAKSLSSPTLRSQSRLAALDRAHAVLSFERKSHPGAAPGV